MPSGVYPRKPLSERFWSKVDKTPGLGPNGDCWEWKASKQTKGYGQMRMNETMVLSHRVSWIFHYGEPGQMHVLHKCDNPSCVNPKHLFLGSNEDNHKDKVYKDRQAKGRKVAGVVLVEDQVSEIRKSPETQRALARKYGVSQGTISAIKLKRSWKHIS